MSVWVIYETTSGRIVGAAFGTKPSVEEIGNTLDSLKGTGDAKKQYVKNTVIIDRPIITAVLDRVSIPADGLTTATLSGLPKPCTVNVDNQAFAVGDGMLEISFDVPGRYALHIEAFPYQTRSYNIEAV